MHSTLTYRVFEPQSTDRIRRKGLGVAVSNHLGSGLNTDMPHKAQRMAEHLNAPVIAYDRPSTGFGRTFALSAKHDLTASHILQAAARTGKDLTNIAEHEGITTLVLTGNSSAALDQALMVSTEQCLPNYFALGDMVGLKDVSRLPGIGWLRGLAMWTKYQAQVERRKPSSLQNSEPGPNAETKEAILNHVADIWNYSGLWPHSLGLQALAKIATESSLRSVNTYVALPEHTFTATSTEQSDILVALNSQRDNFVVKWLPGTYHSQWDDPTHHAELVESSLALPSK